MIKELPVIGVYGISNTMAVCVHEMDYSEDRVLASYAGQEPEWCFMDEHTTEDDREELESGFWLGSFFIPFSQVMRV